MAMKRAFRKIYYANLLLRIGGPKEFFGQLKRQVYSRDKLIGLEKDLDTNGLRISSKLPYSLREASSEDIEEMLVKAKTESKESVHELIERKWFYESGFHDCYAARNDATGELYFLAWLVSMKDSNVVRRGFKKRLPTLGEKELLLENCYTFEKYRGKSIMPSVLLELWKLARNKGFKRLITYVRQHNESSLKVFKKLGLIKFEEVPELKLFFLTIRKHK
jgi:ribosomal protein S18 acetylase RimI-like enzyme